MKSFLMTFVLVVAVSSGLWAGEFKAVYSEVANPQYKEWQADMQKEKALETIAADLNSVLIIPKDVKLTFGECKEVNAFYSPDNQSITMCYELIDDFYKSFAREGIKEDQLDDVVLNATMFTFYHELGHALIDILDIPSTGKEEDAVDQLSTFVLADGTDEGEQAALDGAESFYVLARQEEEAGGEPAYWDEHSLSQQRYYNILCWVYGENPDKFQDLVKNGDLPADRAERCPDEWAKIDKSWSKLLAANIKQQ